MVQTWVIPKRQQLAHTYLFWAHPIPCTHHQVPPRRPPGVRPASKARKSTIMGASGSVDTIVYAGKNPTFRNTQERHDTRGRSISRDRQASRAIPLAEVGLDADAELSSPGAKSESTGSPWVSLRPEAMKPTTRGRSHDRSRSRHRSRSRSRSRGSLDRMESSRQAHFIAHQDVFFIGGTENNEVGTRSSSIVRGGSGSVGGGTTSKGMEPAVQSWGLTTMETFLKLVCFCLSLVSVSPWCTTALLCCR